MPDDERCEIIDGRNYAISQSPRITHQRIIGRFFYRLKSAIDQKCPVFIAPADMIFDIHNIVQPDVFVVCEQSKITDLNIQESPDLIGEVTSPSTSLKDRREKRNLFESFSVSEYSIAYPEYLIIKKMHG